MSGSFNGDHLYSERYGPTYRFFVRGTSITVLCNDEGIKDTFYDKARAFSTYTGHRLALRVVGAVKDDVEVVHLMNDRLFPIVARGFGSTSGMAYLTSISNDNLFSLLSDVEDDLGSSSQDKPLTSFLGRVLYKASSKTLFGDLFPIDSYTDFEIVDENFFLLISPLPFVARHVVQARTRLLKAIGTYIQVAWKDSHVEGAAPVVSEIVSAIKAADLTLTDEAGLFLNFVWGVRSNSVRSASWLFAHLLTNQDAFARVREEIDGILDSQFSGDLGALLNSHHSTLGSHNFPLLDSAIKETLRLAVLYGSLREARRDIEVEYGNGKKVHFGVGDLLLPNLGTLHHDSEAFEDAGTFRVDRYLSADKEGPVFWGFGGGTHVVCIYILHPLNEEKRPKII